MQCCQTCGMLAAKRVDNWALVEAPEDYRYERNIASGFNNVQTYQEIPVCFSRSESLRAECHNKNDEDAVLLVLAKDRSKCPGYTEWIQGFTPKEHYDMNVMERMQRDARRHQLIELVVVGLIVPAVMILAQIVTTSWQTDATIRAAIMQIQQAAATTSKPPVAQQPPPATVPDAK